jgi:predicted RNase H-like nuclease (RuvC/YqgF family)
MDSAVETGRNPLENPWSESASTETTGSEEINDSQSVLSDLHSLSGRTGKRPETRKLLGTIQRLKQENASLKEALESSSTQDLGILRTKLRGAHADITRLKQYNNELKERIQMLERKLLEYMSSSSLSTSESTMGSSTGMPSSALSIKDKLKLMKRQSMDLKLTATVSPSSSSTSLIEKGSNLGEEEEDITPPIPTKKSSANFIAFEDHLLVVHRCKHFEKLLQSYERRMEVMNVSSLFLYYVFITYNLIFVCYYDIRKN